MATESAGDTKRARIIAEEAARDEARKAAGTAPKPRKPRTNWASSQPERPPGRRGFGRGAPKRP